MTSSTTQPSPSGEIEHLTDFELAQKTPEALSETIRERLSVLEPKKRAMVEKRAADVPISARGGYVRSALGEAPPRQAIKAFCLECVYWIRSEVTQCTALACPLYEYRPFAGKRDESPANEGVEDDGSEKALMDEKGDG